MKYKSGQKLTVIRSFYGRGKTHQVGERFIVVSDQSAYVTLRAEYGFENVHAEKSILPLYLKTIGIQRNLPDWF